MSDHGHHGNGGGYEPTDAAAKPIIVFVVILTVFTLACFALSFVAYKLMEHGAAFLEPKPHPMTSIEREVPEGTPLLELNEPKDLAEYRKTHDDKVNTYGWISREGSVVRVPVDKAIDLVLKNKELKSRE